MKYTLFIILIALFLGQLSCENWVEIDVPGHKIVSETVFNTDETANSAVVGIYNELFNSDFSNGDFRSITLLGGLSGDNLQTTVTNNALIEFGENNILINNSHNLRLWSSAYNIIYMCNAIIHGLQTHEGVSAKLKEKLIGEVRFVRAFSYFYLVNLYGEVPLIQTTDYRVNALASKTTREKIYEAIIGDLENAKEVLGDTYQDGERIRPIKLSAIALLARVYLHLQDWDKAETLSGQVIESSNNYTLLNNLDEVFLTNSQEAIWQISPIGRGILSTITNEARIFIITSPPPNSQTPVSLSEDFISTYQTEDARLSHWVGEFNAEDRTYYYPFKYKSRSSEEIMEYSMVMRLAEQYLIRAEARTRQGKLTSAIDDLDKIRERANLDLIANIAPEIGQGPLLDSIIIERRRELFGEWGHRWLDLKRTGEATEVLSAKKTSWQETDILYPIPEEEINTNPNLTQNNGY